MNRKDFEKLVAQAIDALPVEVIEKLDNMTVCVEDDSEDSNLLGEYVGVSQIERDEGYSGVLPDKIVLYWRAIEEECGEDPADVREEIRRTLWHEIAHHLGWDDEELGAAEERRGWR